jgi:hypothetical protein
MCPCDHVTASNTSHTSPVRHTITATVATVVLLVLYSITLSASNSSPTSPVRQPSQLAIAVLLVLYSIPNTVEN